MVRMLTVLPGEGVPITITGTLHPPGTPAPGDLMPSPGIHTHIKIIEINKPSIVACTSGREGKIPEAHWPTNSRPLSQ